MPSSWWNSDPEDEFSSAYGGIFNTRKKPSSPFSIDDKFNLYPEDTPYTSDWSRNPSLSMDVSSSAFAPAAERRPKTAYDRFMEISNAQPVKGEKQYETGKWGKLGAVLAGAAYGGLTKNPQQGMALGGAILDRKYEKAYEDWESRFKPAKEAAIQEINRDKEDRAARAEEAQTKLTEATTKEKNIGLETLRAEKRAEIEDKIARTGLTEVQTLKVIKDIEDPDLEKVVNNKGGVSFFNRDGKLVNTVEGVNVSDADIAKLDHKHKMSEIGYGAAASGAQARKTLEQSGLQEMQQIGTRHRNARELARDDFGNNIILKGMDWTGRQTLQDDKQVFDAAMQTDRQAAAAIMRGDANALKRELATNRAGAIGKLSSPQARREFTEAAAAIAQEYPDIAAKIKQYYKPGDDGLMEVRNPNGELDLDLFNKISLYAARKRSRRLLGGQ